MRPLVNRKETRKGELSRWLNKLSLFSPPSGDGTRNFPAKRELSDQLLALAGNDESNPLDLDHFLTTLVAAWEKQWLADRRVALKIYAGSSHQVPANYPASLQEFRDAARHLCPRTDKDLPEAAVVAMYREWSRAVHADGAEADEALVDVLLEFE